MTYNITSVSYSPFHESEYSKNKRKEFCEILSGIVNERVIPKFGKNLKLSINLGLYTSDEYGSYRIDLWNQKDQLICYIIADTIIGKWTIKETIDNE